jgi:hypothetical protein
MQTLNSIICPESGISYSNKWLNKFSHCPEMTLKSSKLKWKYGNSLQWMRYKTLNNIQNAF